MLESIKQKEIILNIIKETDQISNMNEINDENIAFFRDRIRKNIFMLK